MTTEQIQAKLAAPFPADAIGWKAQSVKGNRALAVAYIDARNVQQRLDDVLGVADWQDDYSVIEGGSVVCRLSLKIGDEWITKMDVGSPSEQPDCGDRMKAAFSDALKRAGVKWGIGRYLYELPAQWCDYDPQKKQFLLTPGLPAQALPTSAQPERDEVAEAGLAKIKGCASLEELRRVWDANFKDPARHTEKQVRLFKAAKEQRKVELQGKVAA